MGINMGVVEHYSKLYPLFPRHFYSSIQVIPSKMTVLLNHRVYAYKASMNRRRDISPKKTAIQKIPFNKKTVVQQKTVSKLMWILTQPVEVSPPVPSAPPAIMETRTICVWDQYHTVTLPEGFDIYEGLRQWYPTLYKAAMDEEEYNRQLNMMEGGFTEADMEDAWAHQDYLEWLYD